MEALQKAFPLHSGYLKDFHLSSSQLEKWKKSKYQYIKSYFLGEKTQNYAQATGTEQHEEVEHVTTPMGEKVNELYAKYCPEGFVKEHSFTYQYEIENHPVLLTGRLDCIGGVGSKETFVPKGDIIIDYKNSLDGKWTKEIANSYSPMYFYGFWYSLQHGALPTLKIINSIVDKDRVAIGKLQVFTIEYQKEVADKLLEDIKDFLEWIYSVTPEEIEMILEKSRRKK